MDPKPLPSASTMLASIRADHRARVPFLLDMVQRLNFDLNDAVGVSTHYGAVLRVTEDDAAVEVFGDTIWSTEEYSGESNEDIERYVRKGVMLTALDIAAAGKAVEEADQRAMKSAPEEEAAHLGLPHLKLLGGRCSWQDTLAEFQTIEADGLPAEGVQISTHRYTAAVRKAILTVTDDEAWADMLLRSERDRTWKDVQNALRSTTNTPNVVGSRRKEAATLVGWLRTGFDMDTWHVPRGIEGRMERGR